MNDSRCKFCGEKIRWTDDEGKRLALDLVPAVGGSYAVAGAETARKIPKARRAAYGRLYRPHKETCVRWDDAKAMMQRQAKDRLIQKQLDHERATLPENVVMLRKRRPRR